MFESIGPVWDGNEVWLVVAGGATFAAFPAWYATMFSGFYIALLLMLVFLIVRVISFEWREKSASPRWRAVWMWANSIGSYGAALIWGVAFANLVQGVPIDSSGDFTGDVLGSVQRLHRRRRHRGRAHLRLPRRDVPDAAHDGRPLPARGARGRAAVDRGGRRRRRVPRLDGRGRGRQERQGPLPADPAGAARDRRARAGAFCSSGKGAAAARSSRRASARCSRWRRSSRASSRA